MKQVTIDCARIGDQKEFHEKLARELEFPQWYGHNLDALYDCLSELGEETRLILSGWRVLQEKLGEYGIRAVFVLHRASEDNPRFFVELE